jgi:hypothetical protein
VRRGNHTMAGWIAGCHCRAGNPKARSRDATRRAALCGQHCSLRYPSPGSATRLCSDFRASASSGRGVLRPAAMATAANTAHGYMPWPLAARASTTTRPAAGVRAASAPRAWTGRPPPPVARRAVAAKAGAAEVRPSSSPDAVTYTASISTDAPLYEPPGVSQRRGDGID